MVKYTNNVQVNDRIKRHKLPPRPQQKTRRIPFIVFVGLIFILTFFFKNNPTTKKESDLPVISSNSSLPTNAEFDNVINSALNGYIGAEFFDTANYLANRYKSHNDKAHFEVMKLLSKGDIYNDKQLKLINSLDNAENIIIAINNVNKYITEHSNNNM